MLLDGFPNIDFKMISIVLAYDDPIALAAKAQQNIVRFICAK